MRLTSSLLAPALLALALPAQAACYADYKAKQDGPLRLHYGVLQLSEAACGDAGRAEQEAARRLQQGGWTLLDLMSTFGDEGLARRQASAGAYFLRF